MDDTRCESHVPDWFLPIIYLKKIPHEFPKEKLKRVGTIQSSGMQSDGIVCMILFCSILIAGCIQLPGIHIISDTPDPIIGQWVGGEPPETDMHVIFYENQSFVSVNFFIRRGVETDFGTWTRIDRGRYTSRTRSGEITNWTYDAFEDSVYVSTLPQRKYYRYKG